MLLKSGGLKVIIFYNSVVERSWFMIRKQVGKRIREIRLSKGISQEDCAFNCDLNRTYFGSVERGERNISIINLNKICLLFDVSLKDFFDSDIFKEKLDEN